MLVVHLALRPLSSGCWLMISSLLFFITIRISSHLRNTRFARTRASVMQSVSASGGSTATERGRRCLQCFTIRLTEAARVARRLAIPYFATTLASSRWKSLDQINRAGLLAEETVNAEGPLSDFKVSFWPQNWRKGGLQERRNQLLKEFDFYNQQYCGCEFSRRKM